VLSENGTVKNKEESTKVLKTEKTLQYMQDNFIPGWIEKQNRIFKNFINHSTKFEYYASIHLKAYKRYKDYENMKHKVNRILKDFANDDIRIMKKLKIKLWLNDLKHFQSNEELSRATRNKYKSIFNKVFELALDDEVIERNFISEIKIEGSASDNNSVKPFSLQEVSILLEKSKNPKYGEFLHLYIGMVVNLGLSPSEAIGLQVGDINYDTSHKKFTLAIQRGITKKKVGKTKNSYRKRVIVLRDEALIYAEQLIEIARSKYSIWLFSREDGSRLDDIENIRGTKAYFSKKYNRYEHRNTKWYKLLEDCNMEYRNIKNCRHTFTMAMLDAKIYSHTELADMLGHSDLQMVIKHYAKAIKGKALDINSSGSLYSGGTFGGTNKNMELLKIRKAG
jgi:integrase